MTVLSQLMGRLNKLPPPTHDKIAVDRDLTVPMSDGTVLLATRVFPVDDPTAPIVLMRSPYGRTGLLVTTARLWAERGYQMVIQSVRGTFGSGGEFVAFRNERPDGHDTVEWILKQPWYAGKLATTGPSYLGLTQWALSDMDPGAINAMTITASSSNFRRSVIYPWGLFAVDTGLSWITTTQIQEKGMLRVLARTLTVQSALDRAFLIDPLEADELVVGHPVQFYRDWITHVDDDEWWQAIDFRESAATFDAPIGLVGGWHDLFLPAQVADFKARQSAGRETTLTIGPWKHASSGMAATSLRESFELFDQTLKGKEPATPAKPPVTLILDDDVRIYAETWPPKSTPQEWHLGAGKTLGLTAVATTGVDVTPIPNTPIPIGGGVSLNFRAGGMKKNNAREASNGVISYTGPMLDEDLAVGGDATIEVWVDGDLQEVAVRICDVDEKGVSRNVSDSVQAVTSSTEPQQLNLEFWPMGHVFKAGHRLRLQVACGLRPSVVPLKALPRNTSNPELRVWHGGAFASVLRLPILDLSGSPTSY